ncbi:hypothetical protein OFN97_07465 [Campylobacter sp. VBCF_05 NA6]|uniref:hypothetical protein n=1 Tax=unclassified Campylobacter TaxID=2593542 RepID=UPI0022E9D70D|nr:MULTISPECIES: hypothetical protein [unclassified Campylobacter]MDA3058271.1 hypothetical protein [Campylobacter sp. VBCF_04 NA7]MDA3059841.1 hypothetical protein [Campylobacter sp. VBCF_05 NA6]
MTYKKAIKDCKSFKDIIKWHEKNIPGDLATYCTNRGENILENDTQLEAYMRDYGKMHKQKLDFALKKGWKDTFDNCKSINVIDYGCGQGIGTGCLIDFLQDKNLSISAKLIEASKKARDRCEINLKQISPNTKFEFIQKEFTNITKENLEFSEIADLTVHIFSNVIDLDDSVFNIEKITQTIKNAISGRNLFICVSPDIKDYKRKDRNKRLDDFISKFITSNFEKFKISGNKIYGYGFEYSSKE